jgi:hypothetical protein
LRALRIDNAHRDYDQGALSICASIAQEALDIVSHDQFDVLLSDVGMPDMDGLRTHPSRARSRFLQRQSTSGPRHHCLCPSGRPATIVVSRDSHAFGRAGRNQGARGQYCRVVTPEPLRRCPLGRHAAFRRSSGSGQPGGSGGIRRARRRQSLSNPGDYRSLGGGGGVF